jgi:hypothetical protein
MTVYVYHEYTDDQAYGTQEIKVFADKAEGRYFLRTRVEYVFEQSWDLIQENLNPDDTMNPDYVCIDDGDSCSFFVLEEKKII